MLFAIALACWNQLGYFIVLEQFSEVPPKLNVFQHLSFWIIGLHGFLVEMICCGDGNHLQVACWTWFDNKRA